jgi:hypothetical protein
MLFKTISLSPPHCEQNPLSWSVLILLYDFKSQGYFIKNLNGSILRIGGY